MTLGIRADVQHPRLCNGLSVISGSPVKAGGSEK